MAGHRELHHVLRDEKHVVLEQRTLHFLALPRAFALRERGHRTDRAEHAAHDVVHARAGAQRPPFGSGHIREAAHHLHDFVQCRAMVVRPRQKALVRNVDEARVQLRQRGVAEPELVHRSALEVLAEDVRAAQQLVHDFEPARIFNVDGNAFLVAVEGAEETRTRTAERARAVAGDRLDLDDLRTQVREHHAAGRAHHHVGHLDHAHAAIGQRRVVVGIAHCAAPLRQASGWTALGPRPSA
ncbi:hypothetical protein ABIE53_006074 [Burkholderia sp. OAS925]